MNTASKFITMISIGEITAQSLFPLPETVLRQHLKYLLCDAFNGKHVAYSFIDFVAETDLFTLAEALENPDYIYREPLLITLPSMN